MKPCRECLASESGRIELVVMGVIFAVVVLLAYPTFEDVAIKTHVNNQQLCINLDPWDRWNMQEGVASMGLDGDGEQMGDYQDYLTLGSYCGTDFSTIDGQNGIVGKNSATGEELTIIEVNQGYY